MQCIIMENTLIKLTLPENLMLSSNIHIWFLANMDSGCIFLQHCIQQTSLCLSPNYVRLIIAI